MKTFYYKDPYETNKEDYILANSMLSQLYFLLIRNFFSREECRELRTHLITFLKYGYLAISTKFEKKTFSKKRHEQNEDIIEEMEDNYISKSDEVMVSCKWMIILINCLHFMEINEQDYELSEFFLNKKLGRYFEHQNSTQPDIKIKSNKKKWFFFWRNKKNNNNKFDWKNLQPQSTKIMKEKDFKIKEFLNDREYPHSFDIFILIELLLLNNMQVLSLI